MLDRDRTARIAGGALLVICASAFLSNNLVVPGDAVATAHNIVAQERWYRTGVLGELIMLNGDIILAVALYRLLAPINAGLALAGTVWRLANATMLAIGAVAELTALRVLTDAHYAAALGSPQTAAMMRALLDLHGTATTTGLIFFGLGAGVHAWLFWVSRLIPRVLAGAYLAVAVAIFLSCTALVVFPGLIDIVDPWVIAPDFVVELVVAVRLLVKGVGQASSIQPAVTRSGGE